MNILKNKFSGLFAMGFFHIMSSNVLKNIGSFLSGIMVVRMVSKIDYGTYVYANNILSYFMLFSGLGITSAVFQICCENQKNKCYASGIFTYGVKCSYIINLLIGGFLCGYAFFFGDVFPQSKDYLLAMSFLPVVNVGYELVTLYYRSRLENKEYSYIVTVYTFCSCISLVGMSFFWGIWGIIFSNYFAPLVCMLVAKYKFSYYDKQLINISNEIKHDIWKLALMSMTSNAISNIMFMIDISMISFFIKDESAIASYKIATTVPTAMLFISTSVVTFIYPYFAAHINDIRWTIKNAQKLMLVMIVIFFVICVTLIYNAEVLLSVIFGSKYIDAVYIFQILTVSLFFQGTFRVIIGNLLVTQRAVTFNIIESVLSGLVNVLADYILIKQYQAIGVAFSTTIVMIFSSIIITSYYVYILNKKQSACTE